MSSNASGSSSGSKDKFAEELREVSETRSEILFVNIVNTISSFFLA